MTSKFVQFSLLKDVIRTKGKWYQVWVSASMRACSVTNSGLLFVDPMNSSWPGSSVHGILQARILEWVTVPSCRGSFWPRDQCMSLISSCIGRWVLYHECHLGSLRISTFTQKIGVLEMVKIMSTFNFLLSFKVFKNNWLFKTKTWKNSLILNRQGNTSRLYIVTLLIWIICRVHHEKCWIGWSTSWNQYQEKYQ